MHDSIDVQLISKDLGKAETPLLAVALFEGDEALDLKGVDSFFGDVVRRALSDGEFRGRKDDSLLIHAAGDDARVQRLLVLGAGKAEAYGAEVARRLAGRAVRAAEKASIQRVTLRLNPGSGAGAIDPGLLAQVATEGAALAAWSFRELKRNGGANGSDGSGASTTTSTSSPDAPTGKGAAGDVNGRPVRTVEISAEGKQELLAEGVRAGVAIARGQNLARTLQMRPGNVATPTHLGEVAAQSARRFGFEATILGPKELEAERMHALIAVARGSEEEARLIVLRHNGGTPGDPALILVGKGLTFDSGGISLKPPQGMGDMKFDMSGGAAVIGALQAIAELGLPLNVVGIVPSSENLASGRSMKPGDVIQSREGKSIEVGNTDAEGRLILADALSYAQEFAPAAVVDCATLTGACVVGLGNHAAALLGNDEGLVQELREAGERAGERCWQLPLWEDYRKQIDSTVADVSNVGGRPAGTITAALFLREFVGEMKWAHLDIAGTAYGDDPLPYQRKGGYGFPTRLLVEWVRSRAR